jgi:hypothetical protein
MLATILTVWPWGITGLGEKPTALNYAPCWSVIGKKRVKLKLGLGQKRTRSMRSVDETED